MPVWSKKSIENIFQIKKNILKKKVFLNLMIDSYGRWSKIFKYAQISIASLVPLISLINYTNNNDAVHGIEIITGVISAGMIKFKDYFKADKVKEQAKEQTLRYTKLYDVIERELLKPDSKKQAEDEFIYWVNREYNNTEMMDPEPTYNDKINYIKICKDKNIPYDDDLDELQKILDEERKVQPDCKQSEPKPEPTQPEHIIDIEPTQPEHIIDIEPKQRNHSSRADLKWTMERLQELDSN